MKIFNIYNTKNHKIIEILFFKMKFRLKNIVAENNIKPSLNDSFGKYSVGVHSACKDSCAKVKIGAFCSFADGVRIGVSMHETKGIATHHFFEHPRYGFTQANMDEDGTHAKRNPNIVIENDVWLGANVIVLPGVKIGNGVIVGAQAVVTKDLPDYAIAVGVPAKVIRYRFTEDKIKLLNELKWWDWSDEILKENISLFKNNEDFFKNTKTLVAVERE